MISSMKNMGSVIISAAIILAGTFAAMLPSGVLSLLQIATVVLTGLLMYAIVVLPFFVPSHGENIRKSQLVAFQFEKITYNASACFRAEVFCFLINPPVDIITSAHSFCEC